MSSRLYRMLTLAPLILLALAIACGSAAAPTTSTPAIGVSSAPTTTRPTEPAATKPTGSPTLEATATPASAPSAPGETRNSEIDPISEEQLKEELKQARFSTAGWETNFLLRNISYGEIRGGGPGKDDIPPIDNPTFESTEEADAWLEDQEPVQVANINGDARAYPIQIMIWHEVVNDTVGGEPVVITY